MKSAESTEKLSTVSPTILQPSLTDLEAYGFTSKLPEVFDNTATNTYLECERKFYYEIVLARRRVYLERYALAWGRVFHRIAEEWLRTQDLDAIMDLIKLNIPAEVDDRYGRTQRRMQEAFIEWVQFITDNPVELLSPEQPVTITCNSACPYSAYGCHLTYGGRLDNIAKWNAMTGPLDIKTTVSDQKDPVSEWSPSHQMEGYVWLASHLIGEHCWGVIVEQVVCNSSKIRIKRFPVPFTRSQIKEWAENERIVHDEIRIKHANYPFDERPWKQNKARCWLPYACPHRDTCLSPRDHNFRYKWLLNATEERRWDFNNPGD